MSACLSATSVIYALFGLLLVAGLAKYMRGQPAAAVRQDVLAADEHR
jgi:hypothetical protein